MKTNYTQDGVVVDFSRKEKAKQSLAGEELSVEGCDSENEVCSLMADSKGKVFEIAELIDVVRLVT